MPSGTLYSRARMAGTSRIGKSSSAVADRRAATFSSVSAFARSVDVVTPTRRAISADSRATQAHRVRATDRHRR